MSIYVKNRKWKAQLKNYMSMDKFPEIKGYDFGNKFDFKKFREVTHQAIRNLDNVIDANYYPTKETQNSNLKHRPVGLGVQGLADVFAIMKLPFESDEARKLNNPSTSSAHVTLVVVPRNMT